MKKLYAIRIVALTAVVLTGLWAIAQQNPLEVIYPNGGETLHKGYSYELKWSDSRDPAPSVVSHN